MTRIAHVLLLAFGLLGCEPPPGDPALGTLSLALDAHAGGIDYRLDQARFALAGPESHSFSADGEGSLSLELTPGSYTLTLLEGYTLSRVDDAGSGSEVSAKLVSANPAPLTISAGQTTTASLRFELSGGATLPMGTGTLAVELEVVKPETAGPGDGCTAGLRISELDYEQSGPDEAEFVELVNTGACDAELANVALELVNGGDSKVYARYALVEAAPVLPAGQRLLLADATLLATLTLAGPVLALRSSGLQNGPDGLRIVRADQVLDALAYAGAVAGAGEGGFAQADTGQDALARCPEGFDSDDNAFDFALRVPTPGLANQCG
jgi:hypothetical protein